MSTPEQEVEYRQHRFSPPPGATEVFLVRHGESAPAKASTPFDTVDGQADPDLAPEGSRWEHPWRGLLSSERTSNECVDYFSLEGDSALAVIGKKPDIHPFGCPGGQGVPGHGAIGVNAVSRIAHFE